MLPLIGVLLFNYKPMRDMSRMLKDLQNERKTPDVS